MYVLTTTTKEKDRKLSLCEDIPLSAQVWNIAMSLVNIELAVLHMGLSDQERLDRVRRLDIKQDNLMILILRQRTNYSMITMDAANPNGLWVCTINVPYAPDQIRNQPFRTSATSHPAPSKKLAKQAAAAEAMIDLVLHKLVLLDGKRPRTVVPDPQIQRIFEN